MIIRQISFQLAAENREAFESFWSSKYREAMSQQPGFIAARLLRTDSESDEHQIEIEFESEETASAWRASSDHENLKPRFKYFVPASSLKVLTPVGDEIPKGISQFVY